MRRTTAMQMFANDQGIMLGDDAYTLWINQDETGKTMKITAINCLFGAK